MSFPLKGLDKLKLLSALRKKVETALGALHAQQQDSQQGATHEENRSEHSKDTRATEQSYLARGLASRVADLRRTSQQLANTALRDFGDDDPVAAMALVMIRLEAESEPQIWWLLPVAGGFEMVEKALRIRTLSLGTPLGRALLGMQVGEEESFTTPRGQRSFELLEIA